MRGVGIEIVSGRIVTSLVVGKSIESVTYNLGVLSDICSTLRPSYREFTQSLKKVSIYKIPCGSLFFYTHLLEFSTYCVYYGKFLFFLCFTHLELSDAQRIYFQLYFTEESKVAYS